MKLRITKHQIVSFLATTPCRAVARRRRIAVLGLLLSFSIITATITATPTHAACFSPAGNAGDVKYNGGYRVEQYCNGGAWVRMGGAGDINSNLVGWWKLDDGSGTSAADSSGNSNTGTLHPDNSSQNPVWTTSGMNGGALTFDGVNTQAVSAADSSSLELSGSWTVSTWVNLSALPASGNLATFIYKYAGGGGVNYLLGVDYGWSVAGLHWEVYAQYTDGSWTAATYGGVTTGTWYLVTGVYDSPSKNLYLYLNGSLVATQNVGTYVPASAAGYPLYLGGDLRAGGHVTNGTIDDARVYNRALSAADVMTLYTSTGGTSGDITTGLIHYWKLDEAPGTATAADSVGGTTLTKTGSPDFAAGKINNAASFPAGGTGLNNYFEAATPANMQNQSAETMSMWFKRNAAGDAVQIGRGAGDGISLEAWTDNVLYFEYTGSIYGTIPLSDTNWHMATMVFDGTQTGNNRITGYLDGVQKTLSYSGVIGATTAGSGTVDIGKDGGGDTNNGLIDDVRIYNRALSASDVLTLYNATATACASPLGYTGDLIYNAGTYHVPQYCDGTNWKPLGKVPGAGGTGCTSPAGSEGHIMYSSDYRVVQYCDGTTWRIAGGNTPITGLVGWWNFDEGSGTSAADSSGSGNTGTLTNGPTWTTASKVGPYALSLTGASYQYVTPPDSASLDISGSWSNAAWVKFSSLPASGCQSSLINRFGGDGNEEYALAWDNGDLSGGSGPNWLAFSTNVGNTCGQTVMSPTPSPSTGVWYHVASVYDSVAQTLTLYVNGSAVASGSMAGCTPDAQSGGYVQIGSTYSACNAVSGTIDDVRIYNRALSASEVWRLYNGAP